MVDSKGLNSDSLGRAPVLAGDLPTTACGIFAQLAQLHLGILMTIGGAHPGVQRHAGKAKGYILRRSMRSGTALRTQKPQSPCKRRLKGTNFSESSYFEGIEGYGLY